MLRYEERQAAEQTLAEFFYELLDSPLLGERLAAALFSLVDDECDDI